MNESECTQILAILATNDRTGSITPATISAWALVMDDVPYRLAEAAAAEWLKHHKWMPMPVEFRDILVNALTDLPDPDDAWSVVLDRMRATYPGHPAPTWTAPDAIQRALQSVGGMEAVRINGNSPDMAENFAIVYRRYRERALHDINIGDAFEEAIAAGRTVALPISTLPRLAA